MIEVRPWLYQGKFRDTISLPLLQRHRIKAMLHLAEDIRQPGVETLHIPIKDGFAIPARYIKQGIDFVLSYHPENFLIACGAGISRSTTYTAAILKLTENLSLKQALADIRSHHPTAMPHPEVWKSMCAYFDEPFTVDDLLQTLSSFTTSKFRVKRPVDCRRNRHVFIVIS